MPIVRVTKQFTFEMAHCLPQYEGDCRNIHGHSYALEVTLKGPVQLQDGHENGMVMDFARLKNIIKAQILEDFDHALVLQDTLPAETVNALKPFAEKLQLVPYSPTCENMLVDLYGRIQPLLPKEVRLHRLMLRETGTSYAEYFADDN
jgi:6-pyruvoyltetrahydropterin/6-carboxytetrahydropterin synthase